MPINHTDRATLAGLYLSLFDKQALSALGCSGVWQAFNVLGYALGASPASIKNYRDEFDHEVRKTKPSHPCEGWKRPLKTRSQKVYDQFSSLGLSGYDFHLSCRSGFYCVEVKGLGSNSGSKLMTGTMFLGAVLQHIVGAKLELVLGREVEVQDLIARYNRLAACESNPGLLIKEARDER